MEMWNVTAGTFLKEEIFFPHTGLIQFEYFTQHSGFMPSSALYDAKFENIFSTMAKIDWTDASRCLYKRGTDHLLD